MKILMYSDIFGATTTTFIYNEVKYLSNKHDLLYICNKKINPPAYNHDNVKVVEYKPNKFINKIRWWLWKLDLHLTFKNRNMENELHETVKQFKPDIIHCHFAYESLMFLDNFKNFNIPVVVHFHGYGASQMIKKKSFIKRIKFYLNKDNIYPIIVSEYFINNLKLHGINTKRNLKLYYGIDIQAFSLSDSEPKKSNFIFLQVSSLAEKKGHEYTISAFAKFLENQEEKKKYRLILTGDGERKKELVKLAEELNIIEHIEFVGNVTHSHAKELMQNADVFVHHSITAKNGDTEGIPNAIMEAMAMELPILSTYHAGIPELVEDGINGYLVEEKDIENYAKRMRDICNWGLKTENREKIIENFEYVKHNEKLEAFYNKII